MITCADASVIRGRITLPLRGAWTASLVLDRSTMPSGQVTIKATDGVELSGTVTGGGVFLESAHVTIVGGKGALGVDVEGAYRSAQLRDPLDAIARQTGESISSSVAAGIKSVSLKHWTLGKHRASRALDELASEAARSLGKEITWRVLGDGSLWLGEDTWPAASLPDTDTVSALEPDAGLAVIAAAVPSLLPGVELDGVGKVRGVEHWIESGRIRTWAWTVDEETQRFVRAVRRALGLQPGEDLPRLDRLAYYRAQVVSASSDGKTVDVQFEDKRIPSMQQVPLRVGIPGAVTVVKNGTIVHVGWERGDPQRAHAVPVFEAGAGVSKVVLVADSVILAEESGAQFVALANKVDTLNNDLRLAITAAKNAVVAQDGGLAAFTAFDTALKVGVLTYNWPSSVAASKTKAK